MSYSLIRPENDTFHINQLTWREIQVDLGLSVAVVGLGSCVAAALERLEVLPPPGPTRVLRQPLLLGAPLRNSN